MQKAMLFIIQYTYTYVYALVGFISHIEICHKVKKITRIHNSTVSYLN